MRKYIYVCSPLKGDIEGNRNKAIKYCSHVADQGHIPIAPHVYFTTFLDDRNKDHRALGLAFGLDILKKCDELWIFGDHISDGMRAEILWWSENKSTDSLRLESGC